MSFNFLVSMVYSCTFEQLFRLADGKYHGALPVPVHFLMDEFANVSLPDDFDKLLATMRSRNVFVSMFNFPLFCPKCKKEIRIDVMEMKMAIKK